MEGTHYCKLFVFLQQKCSKDANSYRSYGRLLPTGRKNAVLINDGMPQGERLIKLNQIAIQQMQVLEDNEGRKLLK